MQNLTLSPLPRAQDAEHITLYVRYDAARACWVAESSHLVEQPHPFTGELGLSAIDAEGHSPTVAALHLIRALRERGVKAPASIRAVI